MNQKRKQRYMTIYKRFIIVALFTVNFSLSAFSQADFKTLVNSINWSGTESELVEKFRNIVKASERAVWESENTESNYCFKDLKIAGIPLVKSYIRVNRDNKKLFRLNFILLYEETDLSLYTKIESSLIKDFGKPIKEDNNLIWAFDNYQIISSFIDFSDILTPEIEKYGFVVRVEPIRTFYIDWTKGVVSSNKSNSPIPQIEYFRIDNDNNVFYKEIGIKEVFVEKKKIYNVPFLGLL